MLGHLGYQKNSPWGECPMGLVRSGGVRLGLYGQVANYLIWRTR
ncbi:hypothetical protein HNP46_007082 [Pseudomonas nitritireducens]|uniref:Uncharacterized protein n=1 Tax=Pseudomonas nitroreducens TaxID=46680 RepID=A0A7W7P6B8_PSENT|nr:hypothetical protein [Pseudomonas nitritireducens]